MTTIRYIPLPLTNHSSSALLSTFRLEASDANGSVTQFNEPFSITISYQDDDWQQAGITAEENLTLAYAKDEQWMSLLPCEGCSLDRDENQLTVILDHVGDFALLGETGKQMHHLHLPLLMRE